MDMISHSDAKAAGQKWYFTGIPCPKGHISKRSVSSRGCRKCVDERCALERKEVPERLREKDRRGYWKDPEKARQQVRDSRERHIEQRRADGRASYRKNPEAAKARARAWGRAHPEYLRHQLARRRAAMMQAMPGWLTDQHLAEIRDIYATTPDCCEVDHIVPLRGKNVCGLHVPWNLQHLEKAANRSKGNQHV